MKSLDQFFASRIRQIVMLTAATILPFIALPTNAFVYDDYSFIVNWPLIRSFSNFGAFLAGATPAGQEGVYRPVRTIIYSIDYHLFGPNPVAFHIQSLIVHVLITVMLYMITVRLTKRVKLSFLAALLFGIHPVHTEMIAFATASMDMIGVLFGVSAIFFFIGFRQNKRQWQLWTSVLFALLGILTYELMLALPFIIVWIDIVMLNVKKERAGKKSAWPIYGGFFALIPLYFFLRTVVFHIQIRPGSIGQNFGVRMYVMTHVFVKYLEATATPVNLNLVPIIVPGLSAFGPTTHGVAVAPLLAWQVIATPILIIALIALTVWGYKKERIVALGIGWFGLSLIPVSNIISAGTLYAERYLYFASFGFCLVLAWLLVRTARASESAGGALISFILLAYAFLTFTRIMDWHDSISLWSKTAEQSPQVSAVQNELGLAYVQAHDNDSAITAYHKAIDLDLYNPRPYFNVAQLYLSKKQYREMLPAAESAYKINPDDPEYIKIFVTALIANGHAIDANSILLKAIAKKPDAELYNTLAKSYIRLHDTANAEDSLRKAIELNPEYGEAYNNLATLAMQRRDIKDARTMLEKAVMYDSSNADIYYNLANVYLFENNKAQARLTLLRALEIAPDFKEAQDLYSKISVE